ncbi:MAG: hypothetical protein NC241_07110 [Bacteroides sp.]|nr:hypothetical protein [Bacteroides sp.]MCM1456619.1 hypothetical protein [Lachnoclostridium sp.]
MTAGELNYSLYIFGVFENVYDQTPDSGCASLLKEKASGSDLDAHLSVIRNGEMIYYAFTRPLRAGKDYIGLCIGINGVAILDIKGLYCLFESTISTMVEKGWIIYHGNDGNLLHSDSLLWKQTTAIERIASLIRQGIDNLKGEISALPPVDFSSSSQNSFSLNLSEPNSTLVDAITKYCRVFVFDKSQDNDDSNPNSSANIIRSLNTELSTLRNSNNELQEAVDKQNRRQKQTWLVILLAILAIGGLLTAINLNGNLQSSSETVEKLKDSITSKDKLIEKIALSKDSTIESLNNSMITANSERDYLKRENKEMSDAIAGLPTIVVSQFSPTNKSVYIGFSVNRKFNSPLRFFIVQKNTGKIIKTLTIETELEIGYYNNTYEFSPISNGKYWFILMLGNNIVGRCQW